MVSNTQPPYNVAVVRDVTTVRALGTWYTNDTGKTLFVYADVDSVVGLAGANGFVIGETDIYTVCNVKTPSPNALLNDSVTIVAQMIVPPGKQYRISKIGANMTYTLHFWIEAY